jgi:predicted dithiol-disulfide oxidoreductase (DUF899 family)
MPLEKTDGMIRHTRLRDESHEVLERREELRRAEVELIRHSEKVAALRRSLPQGTPIQDYCFLEGPEDLDAGDEVRSVRLSQLFSTPTRRPLIIYHFMYGKKQTLPCPMCTMMIDGFNGIASHLAQNIDFAIVAAAEPAALRAHARARGWRRLRLLSAAEDSTFKYDLRSEDAEGRQDSATSVFTLDGDGTVRHFYTNHPWLADDMHERGEDLTIPVYNLLDLTPSGRGNWYARLDYGVSVHWGAYPPS